PAQGPARRRRGHRLRGRRRADPDPGGRLPGGPRGDGARAAAEPAGLPAVSVLVAVGPIGPGQPAREVQDVLDFTTPPPGMLGLASFQLAALDESGLLFTLRSTTEPGVRLFAVAPQSYFPDYAPLLDDATRASLGLGDQD